MYVFRTFETIIDLLLRVTFSPSRIIHTPTVVWPKRISLFLTLFCHTGSDKVQISSHLRSFVYVRTRRVSGVEKEEGGDSQVQGHSFRNEGKKLTVHSSMRLVYDLQIT